MEAADVCERFFPPGMDGKVTAYHRGEFRQRMGVGGAVHGPLLVLGPPGAA